MVTMQREWVAETVKDTVPSDRRLLVLCPVFPITQQRIGIISTVCLVCRGPTAFSRIVLRVISDLDCAPSSPGRDR
jgi:hypothetical protein